ncbi:MAG: LCP family protein [Paenisporosarcina sp.]|nr:LCP family protein [Paenisporosarcina sp.]
MKRKEFRNKPIKPSNKSLIIKISLMLVASSIICFTAYGIYLHKQIEVMAINAYEPLEDNKNISTTNNDMKVKDQTSILFLGIDDSDKRSQGEDNSRSDAIILATLNKQEKTVKLLSIPRDSLVYIPSNGYNDKINHAFQNGGALSSIETIEHLLEVPVDYYVKMNFDAFVDIIDALGGIEAEVPFTFTEKDQYDKLTVKLVKGTHVLDGREALALARTRKIDNDIERGKRQQELLQSLVEKATSAGSITKYGDVIQAVGQHMKTDMTMDTMTSFVSYLKGGMPDIESLSLEGFDDWTSQGYYWRLDEQNLEDTKLILKSHLEIIDEETIESASPSTIN